jgi:hypothetical protein
MNKIKLCILYNSKFTNFLIYNNYELYKKLIKYYGNIELINIDGYGKKNSNKFKKEFRYKDLSFKKYTPHNKINIKNIFKNEKFIVIDYLDNSFKSLYVHYCLNLKNIHFIKINNIADLGSEMDNNTNNFSMKYTLSDLKKRSLKFLIKFLKRINLLKRTSIDFQCENKKYHRPLIISFLDAINLKHTLKKVLINNRDLEFTNNKELKKKGYILLVDTPINHPDTVLREGAIKKKETNFYHKTLIDYLSKLQKIYNKKIYIGIHPKSNLFKLKSIYKKFKVFKYKTRELIFNSDIVLFFDSGAIIPAFLLDKEIINIQTKLMGNWVYFRSKLYSKQINLVNYNLDEKKYFFKNKEIKKSKLLKHLIIAKKNYKNYFIKKKVIVSKTPAEKIISKEINKLRF